MMMNDGRANDAGPTMTEMITKCDFIRLSRKSGHFKETATGPSEKSDGPSRIGDKSYMPRVLFELSHRVNYRYGRSNQNQCKSYQDPSAQLCTIPSLSAMVVNDYQRATFLVVWDMPPES
ncbi:unnamed protein product [Arabidopsis lyrata]|nr:unnamed protein product [Arabidopsis lyrata]